MANEYEEILQDLADTPDKTFPPKPEVWALVEVERGEGEAGTKWAKSNPKFPPVVNELTLRCRILESARVPVMPTGQFDKVGRQAKGVEYIRLKRPDKGMPEFTNPPGTKDKEGNDIGGKPNARYGFLIGNYTAAMAAMHAPGIINNRKNAEAVAQAVGKALQAAGGDRAEACIGKKMLIKFTINDGCKGKDSDPTLDGVKCEYHGQPVIEKAKGRMEKPVNEVNSFAAATEENINSLVRGEVQKGGGSGW